MDSRRHEGAAPEDAPGDDIGIEQRIGAELRRARQAQGLDLARPALALRIGADYLQALEDGRLDDLPGPTYATGFLRAYGGFLGLDGEALAQRLREGSGPAARQRLRFPVAPAEARRPTGIVVGAALALAVAAATVWYLLHERRAVELEPVPEVPQALSPAALPEQAPPDAGEAPAPEIAPPVEQETATAPVVEEEVAAASDMAPEPVAAAPPAAAPGLEPAPAASPSAADEAAIATPTAATDEATVAAPPAAAPVEEAEAPLLEPAAPESAAPAAGAGEAPARSSEPPPATVPTDPAAPAATAALPDDATAPENPAPAAGAEAAPARTPAGEPPTVAAAPSQAESPAAADRPPPRIELRALEETWIRLRRADGSVLFERLLSSGESYFVPAGADGMFDVGNAGGLVILVDGIALPSLGAPGTVIRSLPLNPEALTAR